VIGLDSIQIGVYLVSAKIQYIQDHVIYMALHSGLLKLQQITKVSDNEFIFELDKSFASIASDVLPKHFYGINYDPGDNREIQVKYIVTTLVCRLPFKSFFQIESML
jgi:hypothetical protein